MIETLIGALLWLTCIYTFGLSLGLAWHAAQEMWVRLRVRRAIRRYADFKEEEEVCRPLQ
jgi:hypothetical protein